MRVHFRTKLIRLPKYLSYVEEIHFDQVHKHRIVSNVMLSHRYLTFDSHRDEDEQQDEQEQSEINKN